MHKKNFKRNLSNYWLITILLLFSIIPHAYAVEFYVSPNGNDKNPGTEELPLASLTQARNLVREVIKKELQENVNIYIKDGTYRIKEPISFDYRDSGSEKYSIVYSVYPGESPVISGGYQITGWSIQDDGTWHTVVTDTRVFRELFINGKRAIRARHPNNGYLRAVKASEDRMSHFTFNAGDIPYNAIGEGMELVFIHDWSISRVPIKLIDHDNNILYPAAKIGRQHFMMVIDGYEQHPRYNLENHATFCDAPGEWFLFPSGKLIYKPRKDEKIESIDAIAPLATQLLIIQGTQDQPVQNLHFKGLIFEHCAFSLPQDGYAGVQATHYPESMDDGMRTFVKPGLQLNISEKCSFSRCTIRHIGGSGLLIGQSCVDCLIDTCTISDISGNGIMIGENRSRQIEGKSWWQVAPESAAKGNTVKNSLIENCGVQFSGAVGIWVGMAERTVISFNEIRNLPYTGVSIGWMWSPTPTPCKQNTVEYNHIHDVMQLLSDGGGIYTLGIQPGTILRSNLIHGVMVNAGRAESNGMFLDEGTTDIVIADNIIHKIGRSPLRFHKAGKNTVRENIMEIKNDIPVIRYNNTSEDNIAKIENTIIKAGAGQNQYLERAINDFLKRINWGD